MSSFPVSSGPGPKHLLHKLNTGESFHPTRVHLLPQLDVTFRRGAACVGRGSPRPHHSRAQEVPDELWNRTLLSQRLLRARPF